jgi:hypothetical protein
MWRKRSAYRIFVGNPERKSPLGRPRVGWKFNAKLDLGEIRLGGMGSVDLIQNRNRWRALVNTVMNLRDE